MFLPSLENDTKKKKILTCRELNDAKVALINCKIPNILEIINLNKIENWEHIKGKSLEVNETLIALKKEKTHSIFAFHLEQYHRTICFHLLYI